MLCAVIGHVPSDYRLNPALAARLMGAGLVVVALLVFLGTALVAVLHLPLGLIGGLVVLVLLAVVVWVFVLLRASYVVRLTDDGYRVRFVRGAGVTAAAWVDVDDAVLADVAGSVCVVLRLKDGRTTAIPVAAIAGDCDAFVRDIHDHLQRGHGIRRLS